MVCDAVPVTCACSGRPTVMGCIAHCGASGCADGFTCEADGHCRALRCMAGEYECPVNFDCIDYVAGEDPHGCTRRSCMVAADCECGACVGSRCYDGPGACVAWKPAG